jgi:hypothetical protein
MQALGRRGGEWGRAKKRERRRRRWSTSVEAVSQGEKVVEAQSVQTPEIKGARGTTARSVGDALLALGFLGMLGFFALAETAITTLWPYKLASLAEQEGEQSPFRLLQKDITRFLTTILIGCTLCTTAATALLTDVTSRVLGTGYVGAMTAALTIFMARSPPASTTLCCHSLSQLFPSPAPQTLFCEVAPKSIAVQFAEEVSRFVARPIACAHPMPHLLFSSLPLFSFQLHK